MFAIPFLTGLTNHLSTTAIDDAADSLSCLITAFLFIISAILISAKTNVGSAIECWLPQTYSGDWGQFSENYCFLKDTYWYPNHEPMHDIPESHKDAHRLSYYQWSSMYLAICGLLFMVPKFVWKNAQGPMDIPILYFCETTNQIRNSNEGDRKEKIKEMAKFLRSKITASHSKFSYAKVKIAWIYTFIKALYLFIAMAQFVALCVFLGQKDHIDWGFTLTMNLLNGITWETTGMFPRVTFCDFTIREMAGNNREETIQCVIGINEFNEKIFLFLYFWLIFLFFATVCSCAYTAYTFSKDNFVNIMLHSLKKDHDERFNKELKKRLYLNFSSEFVTSTGKVVLSFVKMQSDIVAQELACEMFRIFEQENQVKQLKNQLNNALVKNSKNRKSNPKTIIPMQSEPLVEDFEMESMDFEQKKRAIELSQMIQQPPQ